MPKTDLEEMVLRMSADINRFEKSMQKAIGVGNQTAGRIEKRFKDMNKGLSGAFGAVEGAIKGAFAVATVEKFATAMRSAIKSVADIGDAADKLGLTTDEFQRIQFAAQLAGVEADTFANGLKKLAINSSDAARGGGELGKILDANGVKITDANGKLLSQVDVLAKVADLVKNAASEQDKAAIAQAAFGKSGVDLLNLLAQGGAEVRRQMQQAGDDSVTYTAQQIRSAQEYDDALDKLEKRFSVTLKGSLIDFAETTVKEFNAIIEAANKLGSVLQQIMATTPEAQQAAANVLNARSAILNQGTRFGPFNGGLGSQPGMTPAPVPTDGKGALPLNIDISGKLSKPTVMPLAVPQRTPKVAKVKTSSSTSTADKGPNDYQRTVEQLREQLSLMSAEKSAIDANTTALSGYDEAIEKARIAEGLMNDAKKAGLKITPELKANIDSLAGSYAAMQAATDAAREKHEAFVQSVEDMKALSKDVLGGFIDDLIAGKSATDALLGGLSKIADKLIDMAVNSLVENAFSGLFGGGGGGGGLLGGLFGFAKGGVMTSRGPVPLNAYASGGVANSPQMALFGEGRRPEAFVPLPDGRTIPVTVKGGSAGAITNVKQHIIINSPTGNSEVRAMVRAGVEAGNRELIARLPQINLERELRAG